jgi:prolipoprotein diacylglyceryltransferase
VEFSLLGAALMGVACMLAALRVERIRGTTDRTDLVDLSIGAVLAGVAIGRLAAMALHGTSPFTHPLDVFFVRGGVDTGAAALGAVAFLGWAARRDLWRTVDLLAPASLAGLAGWHAGCLLRGECAGTPTSLPWAITLPGSAVGRHPVELYAALLLLAGTILFIGFRRRLAPGVLAGAALAFASVVRLGTEPMRVRIGPAPTAWYLAGLMVGALYMTIRVISTRSRNIPDS